MELRQPPQSQVHSTPDRIARLLLALILLAVVAVGTMMFLRPRGSQAPAADPEHIREVASKLKAAGALDQAAVLYERYLELSDEPAETRASVAYSVGTTFLDEGSLGEALRWFYEAETLGPGELGDELDKKIVQTLERMGRYHAAKAALDEGTVLDEKNAEKHSSDDPVVASIGPEEIRRSTVLQALDDLPPEYARAFSSPEQRGQFLKKYVADELLWRKASKLQYDRDPEVLRAHANLLKQLAVSKFVKKELAANVAVDEADLRNFFTANVKRYERPAKKGEKAEPPKFDDVRPLVERDYRQMKIEQAYNKTIASELTTEDVKLFPERMADDDGA